MTDEKSESRLYVGNLDHRITESNVIKMFSPFGKIVSEDFLWHTRGPKRGEPRGYVFIQFSSKEEAEHAKMKMNGKLVYGRPLLVHFAEKNTAQTTNQTGVLGRSDKRSACSSSNGRLSRGATIAAIKNKLKSLEEESFSVKKRKPMTPAMIPSKGESRGNTIS